MEKEIDNLDLSKLEILKVLSFNSNYKGINLLGNVIIQF